MSRMLQTSQTFKRKIKFVTVLVTVPCAGQHYKDYQEVRKEETTVADSSEQEKTRIANHSCREKNWQKRKDQMIKLLKLKQMRIQMCPLVQMRSPSQKQRNPLRTVMLSCQTAPC